ncbi:MAG: preprotein translocase subunit SecY [Clostridiales bacterium]|jgi:preprotein translocase subunit SecY|nr:preprotein translocase subunit SecY [Clostridiales bacterium]
MFSVFANAWKDKDIRKKLIYILIVLAVYRVGCHIYLPGVNPARLQPEDSANLLALIAGGGVGTIFAMGITPYINASIIMQLLTVAIPYLEKLKEDEDGRKKLGQITRYAAVGLGLVQGIGTIYSLSGAFHSYGATRWLLYIIALLTLITGTIFIMWLGELLTERGIGNGSSFIIFANILSNIPQGFEVFRGYATGGAAEVAKVILVLVVFVAIVAFAVLIQDGERRIPVQYSRKMVGSQIFGGQSSYIPVKVNVAGVMSIIFAISLLQLPQTIYSFVQPVWLGRVVNFLDIGNPAGAVLYVILIFCFTFFYTSFAINPNQMAESLKANSGFIPGIRSGKPTADYVKRTVDRLSWIGAVAYAIIALIPIIIRWIFGINTSIGGTTMLIVVGVALELMKQLESRLLMRHHEGFLGKKK